MEAMQESSLGLEDLQESPLKAPAAQVMLGHPVCCRYRFQKRKMFTAIRPRVVLLEIGLGLKTGLETTL